MAASLIACVSVFWALLPKPQGAAELVEKLRSEVPDEREEATRRLKALGRAALPELEKATHDRDAEVAQRAAALVRVIGVMEKLTPNLLKEQPGIEERLSSGDDHSWTEALLRAVESPALSGPDLDALAGAALRGARGDERKSVASRYLERRVELAGSRDQVFRILRTLGTGDDEDRRTIAWAVGAFELREGAPDVLRLLADPDPRVRLAAVWASGKLGAQGAAPRLIEMVRKKDDSKEPAGDAQARISRWAEQSVKVAAVNALAAMGAKEGVPALVDLLKSEWAVIEKGGFSHLPRDVAGALGKLGAEDAVLSVLGPPARKAGERERHQAIWGLSHLATPGAMRELVSILADPSPAIRVSALGALGQHPMKGAAGDVDKLLDDPNPEVRSAAVWTLRDLGESKSARRIAARLDDADRRVRVRAAEVLCGFGLRDGVPTLLKESDAQAEKGGRDVDLNVLNGVRRPELLGPLLGTAFKGRIAGNPSELLKRIELQTGLKVEAGPEERRRWEQSGVTDYGFTGIEMSLREVLRIAMDASGAFILEQGRIRLVPREEAAAFWKAWWAEAGR